MKQIHILRGPSGSGKTTFANNLIVNQPDHRICSADSFHMVDGEYQFNPANIGQAHAACLEDFLLAIDLGVSLIIVDNTHIHTWEWTNYARIGMMHKDYEVKVHDFVVSRIDVMNICAARNKHAVPQDVVYRMCGEFESAGIAPVLDVDIVKHDVKLPEIDIPYEAKPYQAISG